MRAHQPQLHLNPRWRQNDPYGAQERAILSQHAHAKARRILSRWPGYTPTPLRNLPGLAQRAAIARLDYKDEAERFAAAGLGSFKALGAPYALYVSLVARLRPRIGQTASLENLLQGRYADLTQALVAVCATDGNHGRALAWAARQLHCRCVIYVHPAVSAARREAIARQGAEVREAPGTYDDAVAACAEAARRERWLEISDTAYPGYWTTPRRIMQGYTVLVEETLAALADADIPTHVFVQCGVGGLAAALAGHLWERLGARRPRLIVVEPATAACLLASARQGRAVKVGGALATVMAGLACGQPSTLAWRLLERGATAFMTVSDESAIVALQQLARGSAGDPPVVGGESGVAGGAGLLTVAADAAIRDALALDERSRVLVIGSEGASDRELYQRYLHATADNVPSPTPD
ncbi:MAG TPA: diaminopropionate ammonia-lyase [Candidatus Competibacteraceae bacterium]|nr:diaminopropionate ammonia-lyase [Candidatus Competibacteraceae bacterium]